LLQDDFGGKLLNKDRWAGFVEQVKDYGYCFGHNLKFILVAKGVNQIIANKYFNQNFGFLFQKN
jgi:hypothetical protein